MNNQGGRVSEFKVVLDVGKTAAKLSLWSPDGRMLAKREHLNATVSGPGYRALDVAGIEGFLRDGLREFAGIAPVGAIVPVAHGAGFALLRDGRLALPPLDYEQPLPESLAAAYDRERDAFELTGSPRLPDGLNLGAQLFYLESLHPELFARGSVILPWAQFWAWHLSGVAASEATSLGCHTDLWQPARSAPSPMAVRRGWADCLAPLRRASDCLGTLTADWAARSGLSPQVRVYCGIHDSNAALLAARGFPQIGNQDSTVLSTGTWFIAMRSTPTPVDTSGLPVRQDCLVNVDAAGRPVPSARFMGGREIELLTPGGGVRIDDPDSQPGLLAALERIHDPLQIPFPTLVHGTGPFPEGRGGWVREPADATTRLAATSLYAALVTDRMLDLIGTQGRLLVEGRFAAAQGFMRSLATLRPDLEVLAASAQNDVSCGALRLIDPSHRPSGSLSRVDPLPRDLRDLRDAWRQSVELREPG
ncbi:MAG: hypothetical protein RLZZ200_1429 [Pseudomonadota bacterium]|jgi:sugar (pentulose or hexulose) kinase